MLLIVWFSFEHPDAFSCNVYFYLIESTRYSLTALEVLVRDVYGILLICSRDVWLCFASRGQTAVFGLALALAEDLLIELLVDRFLGVLDPYRD